MPLAPSYRLPLLFSPKQLNVSKNRIPSVISCSSALEDLSQIVHNKVLICTTAATVLGQLSKPFGSAFSGRGFDFSATMRSGGMPSVHSAAVVAASTAIGLERGFADSLFGLSLVFAFIVMYDAQGVRKEVGIHAKVINKKVFRQGDDSLSEAEKVQYTKLQMQGIERDDPIRFAVLKNAEEFEQTREQVRLKESVGHQEIEVIVGAIFGFLLAIGVDAIL